MDQIIAVVPYGEEIPGRIVQPDLVQRVLKGLEDALARKGVRWNEVGLLMMANSKLADSNKDQAESDQSIREGLELFCAARSWYPSLLGTTVLNSFFRDEESQNPNIANGLLFCAVVSSVLKRIPVAFEITQDRDERRHAGARALQKGIKQYSTAVAEELGVDLDAHLVAQTCTGIIFTTGSGHTEAQEFIDFKDCYAVGQELIKAADRIEAQLVGGGSTNRSKNQLQCLYYSQRVGDRVQYRYTYSHAAVLAFLPYSRARLHLSHPYKRVDEGNRGKLQLKFNDHDKYDEGRYFYIEEIDGKEPVDFLADSWGFTSEELRNMVVNHTAIPVEPQAHLVTFASSLNKYDSNIWPNIPIWLDEIDGRVMLRMVRAEAEDSNYYLMELKPHYLRENAERLMEAAEAAGKNVSTLAFLCESRKYVLDDARSNAEAEEMLSHGELPGPVVGIYLNGEYSTGSRQSIGYHNYSQIGALIPSRSVRLLPGEVTSGRRVSGVEIFLCHASRDKAVVREFARYVEEQLPESTHWLDEASLNAGDSFDVIKSAIGREDQVFLVFISDRSVLSDWVQKELRWAIEHQADTERTLIIPVVMDDQGDEVLASLRTAWGPDLVNYLLEHVHVKIVEFTEDESRTKARRVSDSIIAWRNSRRPPDHSGSFMPGF